MQQEPLLLQPLRAVFPVSLQGTISAWDTSPGWTWTVLLIVAQDEYFFDSLPSAAGDRLLLMHRDHDNLRFSHAGILQLSLHLIPRRCEVHAEAEGQKGVLGGLRRLWPVTPCTDLEGWRSATELCQCARVLWFWVGSRIETKPSLQPRPSPSLTYFCIFQPELVIVLAWTGAQPGQFQTQLHPNRSKAKASRWGWGGSAEGLHGWAQPSALPDSFAPWSYWDFSKGKRR